MTWYNVLGAILVITQFYFIHFMLRNFKFLLKKSKYKCDEFQPKTLITIPCKGVDLEFHKNISSFYEIDYPDYHLHFVVESEDDPAYPILEKIRDEYLQKSNAVSTELLIAGQAQKCSQKNHNLLFSVKRASDDVDVLAFADSDAVAESDWLQKLIYPLRKQKYGASTGYRWFIPLNNNFATILLAILNAKVAQLLGKTRFNQTWGGAMAVRKDDFFKLGVDELWANTISDDLSLGNAIRKSGAKIMFCPACLVASYEETTFSRLFEFVRRQFIITRVMSPSVWLFGLLSSVYDFIGSWVALILAVVCFVKSHPAFYISLTTSIVFIFGQTFRAICRQRVVKKLLSDHTEAIAKNAKYDYLLNSFCSILMFMMILSSAFGRTICWRGKKYRLINSQKTEVL